MNCLGWASEEIDNFIVECYGKMKDKEVYENLRKEYPNEIGNKTLSAVKHRIIYLKKIGKINFNKKDELLYSQKEIEWLKERTKDYDFNYETLTKEFNDKFNKAKPLSAIRLFCWQKLGMRWRKHNFLYPHEQRQWLIENYHKYLVKDLVVKFNEKFNASKSFSAISSYCNDTLKLKNINYAQISQKEGFVGANREYGSEHIQDGYVVVKVSREGKKRERWIPKQRYVWEQYYGKIPPRHRVIFLDENRNNFDINNLACVPIEFQAPLSKMKDTSPNLKKCKIISLKLNEVLKEINESEEQQ